MSARKRRSLGFYCKQIFLPQRQNGYRPHFVRLQFVGVFLLVLLALQIFSLAFRFDIFVESPDPPSQQEQGIVSATNQARREAGVEELTVSEDLNRAARAKIDHMFSQQYWSHISPDGVQPWEFLDQQAYIYNLAGENLAKDYNTGESTVAGWLGSDSHRENLLKSEFEEIGTAVGEGTLYGQPATLAVAFYAQPVDGISVINQADGQTQLSLGESANRFVGLPPQTTISLANPFAAAQTLSLPGQIAIIIMSVMVMIYLLQHTITEAKGIKWRYKFHQHPALRIALLLAVMALIIYSNLGSVG